MPNQKTPKDGSAHFAIEGELTIYRAAELRDAILPQINQADVLEIDLSQVTEIDSAGLQLLVSAKLEAMIRDKQLHFTGHSEPVLEVFDLCDLGGFFGDQVVIAPHTAH
ncbi:MAG: STAS domain-containing protein [Sideroxyarcus sp.]|nr:STAS domain-containing protein [Sideroxyarcus sp.]